MDNNNKKINKEFSIQNDDIANEKTTEPARGLTMNDPTTCVKEENGHANIPSSNQSDKIYKAIAIVLSQQQDLKDDRERKRHQLDDLTSELDRIRRDIQNILIALKENEDNTSKKHISLEILTSDKISNEEKLDRANQIIILEEYGGKL
ncbi:MAG: hypothetical protein Q4B03_08415 [Lachnospiraceae bacterium]|nr:hypothetical protein [Lachnospiraceae bacterium]